MDRAVAHLNIEHYRRLLAEEEAKLADLQPAEKKRTLP